MERGLLWDEEKMWIVSFNCEGFLELKLMVCQDILGIFVAMMIDDVKKS